MKQLLKHVMSFEDVNWWMLAGGIALNVGIAAFATILGAYWSLSETTAETYALYGPPLILLGVFLATLVAGAILSRMAYQVPIRHAFLSSLGAAGAFVFGAVIAFNYMLLLLALVAVLGNVNGAMLALPKPHRRL